MAGNPKPRLGRGLSSLISSQPAPASQPAAPHAAAAGNGTAIINSTHLDTSNTQSPAGQALVPLDAIDPNPHQPRQSIEPAALADLVNSIRVSGVLQPVILRPVGQRYQLVAGHRRTEAARQAGLTSIPAVIRTDATDENQSEWALVENIQRENLNPIERARAYRAYIERFHLTHQQAASHLGEERVTISNFLRLLELNTAVQDMIAAGAVTFGHAKILAGIDDHTRQEILAHRVANEGLSVRELETLASAIAQDPSGETTTVAQHQRTVKSAHIIELEQELSRKLGTKLRIFPGRRKGTGKIVIQYFTFDEFDRITGAIQ